MSGEYKIVDIGTFDTVAQVFYGGDEDGPDAYDTAHEIAARANDEAGVERFTVLQVEDIAPAPAPSTVQ